MRYFITFYEHCIDMEFNLVNCVMQQTSPSRNLVKCICSESELTGSESSLLLFNIISILVKWCFVFLTINSRNKIKVLLSL